MADVLQDSDWRRLIRLIQDGTCVLFLGPGLEYEAQDATSTPLAVTLARTLAQRLQHPHTINRPADLAHVAQLFQHQYDRVELEMAVEDFYRSYAGQTTDVHRQLAALPLPLCLDITHGGFLESAWGAANKTPRQDFYWFRKERSPALTNLTPMQPGIYNLFGSLSEPDSLVLTENDLLDFLVNVTRNTPPLPRALLSRLSDPATAFLFLGFGFHHWYLRIVLHLLKAHSDRKNFSLALEDGDFFAHPEQPKTVLFYYAQHRLQFRHASWQAFADALSQHWHAAAPRRGPAAAQAVPENAPTVFLCHCSEDADQVAEVSARLQTLGLRTWVDRQNLRGGDRWPQILPKAIEEWVDYVIVLETPAMLARSESYYYLEIAVALQRARRFQRDVKFIFPAQLIACHRLRELDDLQRTDLTIPQGLEQLAADILHDWTQRRGRH